MKVRFLPAEDAELADAVAYYDVSLDLGAAVAAEVRDSLGHIQEYPEAWELLGARVRRCRLKRFSYGLVYRPPEIIVVAVMHLHRKPAYWKERTKRI